MKATFQKSLLPLLVMAAFGCSDSSDDDNVSAKFSLGLSDAPVDSAEAVYIELDSITLTKDDEVTTVSEFTNQSGETVESVQVNLLDFQGSAQIKIVDESQNIELGNGVYDMELNVIDAGSYVLLENDPTEHAIKVPSSRLRLGEFTVSDQAVQIAGTPAYTIEFDLRQSLVLRGNAKNNNGYIIKPHGVRIVSQPGNLSGTVGTDLTNLGQCTVYLYEGSVTEYGDMFDEDDETFVTPETEITASTPLATATVDVNGTYSIGFITAGSYQVALSCGTEVDDNIQFDGLTIPSAGDITPAVQTVEISASETSVVDFN
ncbi:MAG: DUF4382 domain-containing protein [Gammaproteobacteria bacterium]|nr:DUF4382 domain-containing protein [Gammaproteobacteria bacterium]